MAKKGIRYALFAPVTCWCDLFEDAEAHTGSRLDPYNEELYNSYKWVVRDINYERDSNDYYYYKYATPVNVSPVVTFNGAFNSSNSKDYGDDRVVDTEVEFTGGTLSIELNNDRNRLYNMLFKARLDGDPSDTPEIITDANDDTGEIEFREDDITPFVGVGVIGRSGNNWVAKWYPLVKFRMPNDDNATKQETVTFGHITVEGDIFQNRHGIWKKQKACDSLQSAKAWLMLQFTAWSNWFIEEDNVHQDDDVSMDPVEP